MKERENIMLTTQEVAKRYNVQQDTVSLWCREGKMPGAILVSKKIWMIPQDSLKNFKPTPTGRPPLKRKN